MQGTDRKMVTLVLGGVRSGKSRWAEKFVGDAARVGYVATALPSDEEMQERIRRHRLDRPAHWCTLEEPLELAKLIIDRGAEFDVLLVDCLTVHMANLLDAVADGPPSLESRIGDFLEALHSTAASVVLVSNEVGCGVVPPYPSGRTYRDALGELNQRVAAIADNVVLMVAGLPVRLKGSIGVVP